jgi:hypothetical protein
MTVSRGQLSIGFARFTHDEASECIGVGMQEEYQNLQRSVSECTYQKVSKIKFEER